MRPIIALLLLVACNPLPKEVSMEGKVRDAVGVGGIGVPGADVVVRDIDGNKYGSAVTDEKGQFKVEVPAGVEIFALISSDVGPTSSFTGISGITPIYAVADGELYAFSDALDAEWRERYAGCPTLSASGTGALFGELRAQEVVDPETGENPLVATGRVELWNPRTDEVYVPCYLEADEGLLFDAEALFTGVTGSFAFVGVPEGIYVLSGVAVLNPDELSWSDQFVYVPNGGVVPRFPLWVSFPI